MKHLQILALCIAIPVGVNLAIAQGPGLGRSRPGGGGGGPAQGPGGRPSSPPSGPSSRPTPPPARPETRPSPSSPPSRPESRPGNSRPGDSRPGDSRPGDSRPSGGLDRGRDRDRQPGAPGAPTAPGAPGAPVAPGNGLPGGRPGEGRPTVGGLNRGSNGSSGLSRGPGFATPERRSRYGTTNNAVREAAPIVVGQLPSSFRSGRIDNFVRRQDQIFGIHNNVRWGYYHYNRNWNDDFFFFPGYAFLPVFNQPIFMSPWYAYSFLPPYLQPANCFIDPGFRSPWLWNTGLLFNWNSGWNNGLNNSGFNNGGNQGFRDFDDDRFDRGRDRNRDQIRNALRDIEEVFEQGDRRAMNRLVPRRGRVAILTDDRYEYSVNSEDFYDLLMDGATNSRTSDYQILEVRYSGDTVRVSAQHEYVDPWNNRQMAYHQFFLAPERGNYVVREFGTSLRRVW